MDLDPLIKLAETLKPLVPDVPEDPLDPDVPEDPLDPDVPEDPDVPDVPDEPLVPEGPCRLHVDGIRGPAVLDVK